MGTVVVTSAGKLPCKVCHNSRLRAVLTDLPSQKVIHAVGPIWKNGQQGEELYLQMTVRSCLDKAQELGLTSIAMPAIRYD